MDPRTKAMLESMRAIAAGRRDPMDEPSEDEAAYYKDLAEGMVPSAAGAIEEGAAKMARRFAGQEAADIAKQAAHLEEQEAVGKLNPSLKRYQQEGVLDDLLKAKLNKIEKGAEHSSKMGDYTQKVMDARSQDERNNVIQMFKDEPTAPVIDNEAKLKALKKLLGE